MAHFAKIEDGVVTQVIVVDNKDTADASGVEKEHIGAAFCEKLLGGTWKQTSYNGSIRKNYAGLGYTYNTDIDAFVPPKPFASWLLNEETAQWEAPVAMPEDAGTGSHPSDTHGMKQPPRGSSKVLSGSNNHPRRLYCCMERDKKGSEFAQEAEGVWSQLSKYAGLADQLEQHITTAKNKPAKPKLFGKLDLNKDTQEAFNVFEAEHKLAEMEAGNQA
jgi:hypothetical protein